MKRGKAQKTDWCRLMILPVYDIELHQLLNRMHLIFTLPLCQL